MLVITRKSDQEVWIGEHVRLKVLAVRGNRVQLGIAAPREIAVQRAEHYAGEFVTAESGPGRPVDAIPLPA